MDPLLTEYKIKVWNFLEQMEPDKMYSIANLCIEENRQLFIEAIKEYMQSLPWNGWVTFNGDYSKIYRSHPPANAINLSLQAKCLITSTE